MIENSSNKNTTTTSCFIFLFGIVKIKNLMKKKVKNTTVAISQEICLTRRPGDMMKNLETPGKTGRVRRSASSIILKSNASIKHMSMMDRRKGLAIIILFLLSSPSRVGKLKCLHEKKLSCLTGLPYLPSQDNSPNQVVSLPKTSSQFLCKRLLESFKEISEKLALPG